VTRSKSTLLDVLAGRKTTGVVGGTITLNGEAVTPAILARTTGYCEQDDE
jgi:ABC-type multidrug transport system ATPase subunit